MDRYAIVRNEDGYVINVSLWDGVTPWDPGEGYTAVKSDVAEIGDTYKDGEFIKPPAPEPVAEPTPIPPVVVFRNPKIPPLKRTPIN